MQARIARIKSRKFLIFTSGTNSRFIPGVACSCPKPQAVQRGRNLLITESSRHLPNDSDRIHTRTPVFATLVLLDSHLGMTAAGPVNHQDHLAALLIHINDDLLNQNAQNDKLDARKPRTWCVASCCQYATWRRGKSASCGGCCATATWWWRR